MTIRKTMPDDPALKGGTRTVHDIDNMPDEFSQAIAKRQAEKSASGQGDEDEGNEILFPGDPGYPSASKDVMREMVKSMDDIEHGRLISGDEVEQRLNKRIAGFRARGKAAEAKAPAQEPGQKPGQDQDIDE